MSESKESRTITFQEAIAEALNQEMARDESVFVYGLDVADHKGIYGTTLGLAKKFGGTRCFSTPLSEEAMMGFGLGAATNGLRPINVHIRVDFLLLAMNQLINMVATHRYGSNGKTAVPLVIRAAIGRGWGQGYQHSKTLQSIFAHIPGLKVVMPTTPYDVKGLLIASIRDNNPVIFIEHRWLYFQKGIVPEESYEVPLGSGKIAKEGADITVVATSWMNVEALKAQEILSRRNVSIEIVDVRTVAPLDKDVIIKSVLKTGHCVVADYDWINCGFSSEVAAMVSEECFGRLKSPVTRIGFAPTPCPTTRALEDEFYPGAVDIIRAVEKKLGLSATDISGDDFYSYENKFRGPF
ncbi:alpha-ketoacid dehydrogenase subunit beta [bacterium]|nr:alpha-ketoacid dehydrogenase subunit beta [bacterium]